MKIKFLGASILVALLPFSHAGAVQKRTFYYPDVNGPDWPDHCAYRLDWCLVYANKCGSYAAHDWCRSNGYDQAESWQIDYDIGNTMTIGDRQFCTHGGCDGFKYIRCKRTRGGPTFYNPKYKGKSLDWCLIWENHCGEAAANSFCRMQGYKEAKDYSKRSITNMNEKSRCIGDESICNPTNHGCDTYNWIECQDYYCL